MVIKELKSGHLYIFTCVDGTSHLVYNIDDIHLAIELFNNEIGKDWTKIESFEKDGRNENEY